MSKQNIMVGLYRVSGVPEVIVVECPLQPRPEDNYRLLLKQVMDKFPQCHESLIRRLSSKVESRDSADMGYIDEIDGTTLRGLFPDDGGLEEASRVIGSVFFEGEPWTITLRYYRAKAMVGVVLINRMNGSACPFTQQFQANQLVTELPRLLNSILPHARELKLRMKPTGRKPDNEITRVPGEPVKVAKPVKKTGLR
jgi:hypothetical protein